jgi:ABC-2 type transport system ATP-binding protein
MTEHDAGASAADRRPAGPVALRADRLSKRYGRVWGLRECTLEIPAGVIAGLVGPNGAGKTTLLEMIIGLLSPTSGQLSVFGQSPRAPLAARLAQVAYVAQDHPLYRDFSVADMFRLGRAMNPRWDAPLARTRMDALDIPLGRKVKHLSGGQRAQVSLTMALAKRAPLLVLDEPVSSLDPVARLEFMREVMAAAAGTDADLPGFPVHRTDSDRHSTVLVRADPGQLAGQGHPGWPDEPVGFEQLVMAYLQRPAPAAGPESGRAWSGPARKAVAR